MGYFILAPFALVFTSLGYMFTNIRLLGGAFAFWVMLAFYAASVCGTLPNLFANWNGWICLTSIVTLLLIVWDIFWGHLSEWREKEQTEIKENYDNEDMSDSEQERIRRRQVRRVSRKITSNKQATKKKIGKMLRGE